MYHTHAVSTETKPNDMNLTKTQASRQKAADLIDQGANLDRFCDDPDETEITITIKVPECMTYLDRACYLGPIVRALDEIAMWHLQTINFNEETK